MGGNVCEIRNYYSWCLLLFLPQALFRCLLQAFYCSYLDLYLEKMVLWFSRIFVVRNNSDIHITKIMDALRYSDSALWNYSRPSVCLSARPSLNFLRIGLLIFPDTAHYDSWPWYLVTDEAIFLKKKNDGSIWVPQNEVFRHFPVFGSYVFLKIAYIDSLWQCLTSSKTQEKNLGALIWDKLTKIGLETRFFAILPSLVHLFSFKLHRIIAWNNVHLLVL